VSRGRSRRAALIAALAVLALLPGAIAQADPDVSDDDVRASQEAVRTGAGAVAAVELELAQQSAALDAAWVAVATAA